MSLRAATGGVCAGGRVQVVVRLRPSLDICGEGEAHREGERETERRCVRGLDTRTLQILNWRNREETVQYSFDGFYGEDSSQQEVYVQSVKPLLTHVLNGQNASVFAYGPTGAGKTYTMLGDGSQPGVVPRALLDIFRMSREQSDRLTGPAWTFNISMSYLEIYQEKVLDLLEPGNHDLPIREDRDKNIFIPRLTQRDIGNFSDFEQFFLPALQNRTTASTKLNLRSSRSHAVLLLKVAKMEQTAPFRQLTGKLYLIDLAGSEDNRRTGNEGVRLRESGAINSSLFVLSKVVDALNQGLSRIPYRDSKLTRLLQDSLGGSAHSLMIANIAPESRHYYNTLTALNFAAKSKLVVNHPFTLQTTQPIGVQPLKRSHQEDEREGGTSVKDSKMLKPDAAEEASVPVEPPLCARLCDTELVGEGFDAAVLERLARLEEMLLTQGRAGPPLLDTPRSERQRLLARLDQSLQQIQRLEERQKVLEQAVSSQRGASGAKAAPAPLHNTHHPPQRKQALVSPLQRIENTDTLRTGNVLVVKRSTKPTVCGEDVGSVELCLDQGLAQGHRDHILHLLNHGTSRQLKALPRVGDKTAQIILSWREERGGFQQIEDLAKAGLTGKNLTTFMAANALSHSTQ